MNRNSIKEENKADFLNINPKMDRGFMEHLLKNSINDLLIRGIVPIQVYTDLDFPEPYWKGFILNDESKPEFFHKLKAMAIDRSVSEMVFVSDVFLGDFNRSEFLKGEALLIYYDSKNKKAMLIQYYRRNAIGSVDLGEKQYLENADFRGIGTNLIPRKL